MGPVLDLELAALPVPPSTVQCTLQGTGRARSDLRRRHTDRSVIRIVVGVDDVVDRVLISTCICVSEIAIYALFQRSIERSTTAALMSAFSLVMDK